MDKPAERLTREKQFLSSSPDRRHFYYYPVKKSGMFLSEVCFLLFVEMAGINVCFMYVL